MSIERIFNFYTVLVNKTVIIVIKKTKGVII